MKFKESFWKFVEKTLNMMSGDFRGELSVEECLTILPGAIVLNIRR